MNFRSIILLVSPILLFLTSSLGAYNLMMGTIQFPSSIATVPQVRIYHSGKIIKGTIDHTNKTITFTLPKYNNSQIHYSLVVTESIEFALSATKNNPHNTIQYIKIPDGQDYKLYTLLLVPQFGQAGDSNGRPTYRWKIIEDRARFDNRVPDDAIIVCYEPSWIQELHGETGFELPTLNVKSNVVALSGSAEKFYDRSTKFLLAAIDSDTMHSADTQQTIKHVENRVMIAAPVA